MHIIHDGNTSPHRHPQVASSPAFAHGKHRSRVCNAARTCNLLEKRKSMARRLQFPATATDPLSGANRAAAEKPADHAHKDEPDDETGPLLHALRPDALRT